MKYLLLLCADETTPEVDISAEYEAWRTALGDKHVISAGLHPPTSATTLRVRDTEVLLTDGPFAETKEQIAGLAIIDCPSDEEAHHIAATHPWSRHAPIEIRPIH